MNLIKVNDRYTLALVSGALLSFSMPPFHIIVFVFFSFSMLYFLLSSASGIKNAILISWWFGFSYFATGLYWFAYPLMTDIYLFGWLIPLAVLGLPCLMAIIFSCVGLVIYVLQFKGLLGGVVFAFSITIFEWLLGKYFFYGFPWNLFSYAWSFSLEMLQITSVIGSYGLVFFTVFCGAAFGVYISDRTRMILIIASLCLCLNFIYGYVRLSRAKIGDNHKIKLRLIQANLQDIYRNGPTPTRIRHAIDKYLKLTMSPGFESITHIIWPESSFPFSIDFQKSLPKYMATGKFLIFGANRVEQKKLYNSLFIADFKGKLIDYYDKFHLVPFGEFIPFYNVLKYVIPNGILGQFHAGFQEMKVIALNNTPSFSPLICYESIFPGKVLRNEGNAEWMLNITNDVWFDISSEPYQHFAMSRVRSIEEGVPLIRAANTGISAVIDSYGRIIKSLPIMTEGIIDSELPKKLVNSTLYVQYVRDNKVILYFAVVLSILMMHRFIVMIVRRINS